MTVGIEHFQFVPARYYNWFYYNYLRSQEGVKDVTMKEFETKTYTDDETQPLAGETSYSVADYADPSTLRDQGAAAFKTGTSSVLYTRSVRKAAASVSSTSSDDEGEFSLPSASSHSAASPSVPSTSSRGAASPSVPSTSRRGAEAFPVPPISSHSARAPYIPYTSSRSAGASSTASTKRRSMSGRFTDEDGPSRSLRTSTRLTRQT